MNFLEEVPSFDLMGNLQINGEVIISHEVIDNINPKYSSAMKSAFKHLSEAEALSDCRQTLKEVNDERIDLANLLTKANDANVELVRLLAGAKEQMAQPFDDGEKITPADLGEDDIAIITEYAMEIKVLKAKVEELQSEINEKDVIISELMKVADGNVVATEIEGINPNMF
jgi:hypothetical protein